MHNNWNTYCTTKFVTQTKCTPVPIKTIKSYSLECFVFFVNCIIQSLAFCIHLGSITWAAHSHKGEEAASWVMRLVWAQSWHQHGKKRFQPEIDRQRRGTIKWHECAKKLSCFVNFFLCAAPHLVGGNAFEVQSMLCCPKCILYLHTPHKKKTIKQFDNKILHTLTECYYA